MKKSRFAAFVLAVILLLGSLPVSAAALETVTAPPPPAAPAPMNNPFSLNTNYEEADSIFSWYLLEGGVCIPIYSPKGETLTPTINALPKLKPAEKLSQEKLTARLIKVENYNCYEKHVYELRPGELRFDGAAYALTAKQYESLKAAITSTMHFESTSPYWLIWMNPERVTKMTFTDKTGSRHTNHTALKENLLSAATNLTWTFVERSHARYDPKKVDIGKLTGGYVTNVTFDNGATYRMFIDDKNLYIESSDKDYGYKYENKPIGQTKPLERYKSIITQAGTPKKDDPFAAPETGKPVIYLYPEETTDVSVKLDFKGELCTTIPAYNGGWSVTAQPDGTIVNKADGKTYPYLFWDGNPDFKNWDFSSGFCVKAEDTGAFFREKLPALGLLPHEYKEFIEYWQPILEKNKYNLVTFSTEQYEAVAPLTVSPAPDTVLRVHMIYKGIEKPVSIPAQKLEAPPAREGFTVVEWGGTRASSI